MTVGVDAGGDGRRRTEKGGHDLTSGPIARTLLLFALPTIGSNMLQSLNGSINAVWVGQLLGNVALAATAVANLVMFMIFALMFGFAMASTVIVGQNMGRRDIAGVRKIVGAGTTLFLIFSVTAVFLSWVAAPGLLRLLDAPADVYPHALVYLRVLLLGLPPGLLTLFLSMTLRGTGDSLTPFRFMIAATLIDAVLNPVLILGLGPAPELGIAGSAMANIIASYVSLAALLLYIYRRDLPIRLRGPELRYLIPDRAIVSLLTIKGVPMGLQMIVVTIAALAVMVLVNGEGTSTVAAYGAVNQLWTYIQMPAFGIGAAVSAMAAQNIGAGSWDRVDRITRVGVAANVALTGAALASIILLDRLLLGLFIGNDEPAIAIARRINLLAGWSFVLTGVMAVYGGVTRANGATIAPLAILAIAMIPGRLGTAYMLKPGLGADAIWWSFPISAALATLMTIGYYYHGSWRKLHLIAPPGPAEVEELTLSEAEPVGRIHPSA